MTRWINESISNKAVYRTAPATPGLLIILLDDTSNFFVKKNLEMTKMFVFFYNVKKTIKHFGKKSFSVFRGLPWAPQNTLKLFFYEMFYYFVFTLMKNTFAIISRFFHKNLPALSSNVIFHYNTFLI